MIRFVYDPISKYGSIYDGDKLISKSKLLYFKDGYVVFDSFKIKLDRIDDFGTVYGLYDPLVVFCVSRLCSAVDVGFEYVDGNVYLDYFLFPLDFVSDIISISNRIVRFDSDRNAVGIKLFRRMAVLGSDLSFGSLLLLWLHNCEVISPSIFRFEHFLKVLCEIGIHIERRSFGPEYGLMKSRLLDLSLESKVTFVLPPPYLLEIGDCPTDDYERFLRPEFCILTSDHLLKSCYHRLQDFLSTLDGGECFDSTLYIRSFIDLDLNSLDLREIFFRYVVPHLKANGYRYVIMRF